MRFPDWTPTIPEFIRTRVEAFGDRPLILLGDRRITYRDADALSARLARGLLARGVGVGTRIGLLAPNGPDWVIAWLAATRIGAVLVPMNTFYKPRELGWVLRHADVHILLTVPRFLSNDYLERIEAFAPGFDVQPAGNLRSTELPRLRQVLTLGPTDRSWAEPVDALYRAADARSDGGDAFLAEVETTVAPADPMIVIYSSGSTADPKGAIHTHGQILRHSHHLNQFRDLGSDDRLYTPMPFFWIGGFSFGLVAAMHVGCFMMCEEAFEPGSTLELLERERATVVAGWPHFAKAMADHPSFPERDLSSVRAGNLYDVLPEAVRPADPELRSNALGMTETGGPHTMDRMDVDLPEKLRGSFGRSVPGVEHKIVDPETGATLGPDEFGEICVRGYSVMQGLTKVEREDTFDADGFYRTGDGGRFDTEGYLFFQARLGDMIKTGGANVTPREVEVLLEAMPEVKGAYVLGIPDPARGQIVTAAIVPLAGAEVSADTLQERLRSELSAYKVPKHFFFFADGELPFTDSGKIDKKRLVPLMAARAAGGEGSTAG